MRSRESLSRPALAASGARRVLSGGLVAALLGSIFVAGCGTPTRSPTPRRPATATVPGDRTLFDADRPVEMPGEAEAQAAPETPAGDGRVGAPVREPKTPEEALAALGQRDLLDAMEALHEQDLGDEAFKSADYAKASGHYERALALNPALPEARRRYHETLVLLGQRSGEVRVIGNELSEQRQAESQERLSDARRGIEEAKDLLDGGDEAEVDAAQRKLAKISDELNLYDFSQDVSKEKAEVTALLDGLEQRRKDLEAAARRSREELVGEEKERLRQDEETARRQRVKNLTLQAADYIRFHDYDKAIVACEEILTIDSGNTVAKYWLKDARQQKFDQRAKSLFDAERRQMDLAKAALAQSAIPYNDLFVFPEDDEWTRIQKRSERIAVVQADDPEPIRRIKNELENTEVSFAFEQKPLSDVVAFLRQVTGINIAVDPEVQAEDPTVDLTVTNMKAGNALDLILLQTDLAYSFQEMVLFITKKEKARGRSEFLIYRVADILNKIRDFPGPTMELRPPGDTGAETGAGGISLDETDIETETALSPEDLEDLIKQSTGGEEVWGQGDAYSIEYHKGLLLVTAPVELHAEIEKVLASLREDSDIFVMIEARFINITDDFLEDIGIDSRALGLVNNIGIPFGNIINDTSTGGNDLGFARQGDFVNDVALIMGQDRWAGRIQNIVDGFTGVITGNRLQGGNNISGLTVQSTWLDPFQLNAILRAVQEKSDVRTLTAPTITAHNGERVYVSVITQRAYIADYELVSGGTGFSIIEVADPIVSTFQEGVILDVDPVISHDKKYITLDVRPTLATLIGGVISTILISLGSFTNVAFQVPIGVPEVSLQQTYTSVTVPNGGTVLIGGFKALNEGKFVSSLPILGSIPLVSNLFRRKAEISEKFSLVILITARIVNPRQEEAQRFNTY